MSYSHLSHRVSTECVAPLYRTRTLPTQCCSPVCAPLHLPGELLAQVNRTIAHAWRSSTSSKYNAAIKDFLQFCDAHAIPFEHRLPISEPLLCVYASSFAGRLAGSSIRNKCAALRKWHIANGLPYAGGLQLSYTIKGAENLRPPASFSASRVAVNADMLTALSLGLNPGSPSDICVLFVALASFWGQIRLGELLPIKETGFDSRSLPLWSHLGDANNVGSRILHLPRTKTGGSRGEDIFLTRQSHLDPIACLELHQLVNGSHDLPLASYRTPSGLVIPLTRRKFLLRINEILAARGFPRLSGHCFRIGGTTHLLLAGVPPDVVRVMGRWSSDSFLRYWRSLDKIAPLYAELLAPLLHDTQVRRLSA